MRVGQRGGDPDAMESHLGVRPDSRHSRRAFEGAIPSRHVAVRPSADRIRQPRLDPVALLQDAYPLGQTRW